jgi:TIR domain
VFRGLTLVPKPTFPKPKIFISHSAKEAEADKVLKGLVNCLKTDFEVLVDKERLKGGDDFREEILGWINRAHGAVILFSANALTRPWVKYEAGLLSSRRTLAKNKSFTLIPVLINPVTRDDLESADLSPMQLAALQFVSGNNVRQICKQVRERFSSLLQPKLPPTPFEELLMRITPLLRGVDEQVLLTAAIAMDVDVSDWSDATQYPELLATQMLTHGLSTAGKAIRALQDFITPQTEEKLIELIAPMWVNVQAASAIPRIATNSNQTLRRLWLNGGDEYPDFTAGHFVRRACSRAADSCWPVLSVPSDAAEDELGYYKLIIREKLKLKLLRNESATDKEIKLLLDQREKHEEPIFVAFYPPGPSSDVLAALRPEFPTLTFFILTGNDAATELANFPDDVEFLEPRLTAGEEAAAYAQYITVRSYRLSI